MTIGSDLDTILSQHEKAIAAAQERALLAYATANAALADVAHLTATVASVVAAVEKLGGSTPPPTEPPAPPVTVNDGNPFTGRWKERTPASTTANGALTSAFRSHQATVWLNCASYSVPVYRAKASDPLVTITPDWNRPTVTARIPAGAVPAAGTDSNMAIIQPDGTTVDIWTARWVDATNIHAGRVLKTSLSGTGFGPLAGIRAAGCSTLGGLIRLEDIAAGRIDHGLAVAVPTPMLRFTGKRPSDSPDGLYMKDGTGTSMGYVAPATEQDYNAEWVYKGQIPMGSKLVLPRSVDIDKLGLNPTEKMIAVALQEYGAYILDTTGSTGPITFYAEAAIASQQPAWLGLAYGTSWGAQGLTKIRQNLVVAA